MQTFIIEGKELELKIDFKGISYLNGIYEGGSMEVIGKAMMGDFDLFPKLVRAALFHTGENFTQKQVDKAIEDAVNDETLDLDSIMKISNQLVNDNFFYKATVAKLLKDNPAAKKALAQLTD